MYCINCGNKLKEQAKFCDNCGANVDNPQINSNYEQVQPKKSNGCLVATIIGVVVIYITIPLLIFGGTYFIIKKAINSNPKIECCVKAGGNYNNGICKNYDKAKYNKCIDNTIEDDDNENYTKSTIY